MKIINHPLCHTTIGAPSDMQDDCSALPVAYRTDQYGTWAMSFWQPDADELAMLAADGGITLHVRAAGRQHPVVAMSIYPSISPVPQVRTAIATALADSKQLHALEAPAAGKPLCLSEFASLGDYLVAKAAHGAKAQTAVLDELIEQRLQRVEAELAAANEQVTDLIAIVAQQVTLPFGEVPMLYPRTMTPALEHVLGFPNFRTSPIAHVFQKAGFSIPTKSEAEQAFVLDRMIRAVLTHGEGWADVFGADVRAQQAIIEQRKVAAQADDAAPTNSER
jgi:hypothetical protein